MKGSAPKELLTLLQPYHPGIQELALALRQVVIDEMAPCCEYILEVYIISLIYGPTERVKDAVCYIGVMKDHINLGFQHGAKLSDRQGILEGDGKQMRHIKIRSEEDLLRPAIRDYIQEACERAGHAVSSGKKRTVTMAVKFKSSPKRTIGTTLV